jgi:hypothetical protein
MKETLYLPLSLASDFAATVYTFLGTAQSTATGLFATNFPLMFVIA